LHLRLSILSGEGGKLLDDFGEIVHYYFIVTWIASLRSQ